MARRRPQYEGAIVKRVFKRPDSSSYTRFYARITVAYDDLKQQKQDDPMRVPPRKMLKLTSRHSRRLGRPDSSSPALTRL